jgi:beta-xylosidase
MPNIRTVNTYISVNQLNYQVCEKLGWFPTEFGLKDHSIFLCNGYFYLVSIYLSPEDRFAYGRSLDFCIWENLTPILKERHSGDWDEMNIWALFVYEESGVYYMYYTGVPNNYTQSIMLATSTDPKDPDSWQEQGLIFQPNHDGMIWQNGIWADCRDPTVIKLGDLYYLFYTGLDVSGGIIGLAKASSPSGPFIDQGRSIKPVPNHILESPALIRYNNYFYLFYNKAYIGEYYIIAPSVEGNWSDEVNFYPGWAHEIWQTQTREWYTSYLTNYTVTISKLNWDDYFIPVQPFIGLERYHQLLPFIIKGNS